MRWAAGLLALLLGWGPAGAAAQSEAPEPPDSPDGEPAPTDPPAAGEPAALLQFEYTPAPRAQIAIWVEDADGNYLSTVRLTEATAYRGVGNRPGASQMNSGYRWPYGRREGVLPHWAKQRGAAPQAEPFKRVIFQSRVEGYASRTTSDHSVDEYFCLSFSQSASERDALDAVSCASAKKFSSDKGRYLTQQDIDNGYAEPFEALSDGHAGDRQPLPRYSGYPPRVDHTPCPDRDQDRRHDVSGAACYDHPDTLDYPADVREVMPNIDTVTMATPEGGTPQNELFTVPDGWPRGQYVAVIEVNVEGDYSAAHGPEQYPSPQSPAADWDMWALTFGYPYRGQPSVVYRLPFTLGAPGEAHFSVDAPTGATSWDHWDAHFGASASMAGIVDQPADAAGSGADRMLRRDGGERIALTVRTLQELPEPTDVPPPAQSAPDRDNGGAAGPGTEEGSEPWVAEEDDTSDSGAKILTQGDPGDELAEAVGPVLGLSVEVHSERFHAHDWVTMRFRTPESAEPLHGYEVRVSTAPILDEADFLQRARPARTATEALEGATALMLPVGRPPGEPVEADIGDLREATHYYVGIRAVDSLNRPGRISVAEVTTLEQRFVTVSPCFVATAAFDSPLAAEVGVLRRFRDRLLMPSAPGRALVAAYYRHGEAAADWLRSHAWARSTVRALLTPIVKGLALLDD